MSVHRTIEALLDADLENMSRDQLVAEARKLREGIKHRDSSEHESCWHHPELWEHFFPKSRTLCPCDGVARVHKGLHSTRASLEKELRVAPRTSRPYDTEA